MDELKKILIAVTAAASIFTLSACGSSNMEDAIVTSDAGEISIEEFYHTLKVQSSASSILEQLVTYQVFNDRYEVSDEDVEAELETYREQFGDDFESTIQLYGYANEDDFADAIRGNLAIRQAVEERITDEDIETAAAALQIEASHILVEDEDTANEIIEKLNDGEDFAELAAEYSTDTSTAENGGSLGYFKEGDMVDAFWAAATELEVGEISAAVESDYGWHIIKVTDIQEGQSVDGLTDDERTELIDGIITEKYNDGSAQEIIDAVLADANIIVNDSTFESLFNFSDDEDSASE